MATLRYEISLQVFKNMKNFSTLEEKFCISKQPLFYLLHKHQWNTEPFHFNSFAVKGVIYYVAIATVISHVWREYVICTREDIMFSRESSPGISLVLI